MQLQALFFLMASMPTIAYARAVNVRDGDADDHIHEFSDTCTDIKVGVGGHLHQLEALCVGKWVDGNTPPSHRSKLDLNKCLRNLNGKLSFQSNGYFGNSCNVHTCKLESRDDGMWYICMCGKIEAETEINLDMGIRNKEGTLECVGQMGERVPEPVDLKFLGGIFDSN